MNAWVGKAVIGLIAFVLIGSAGDAYAHKPSDSYLSLQVDGPQIAGRWDIALRDLDYAIGLDANDDGTITWGEVRARHDAIAAYALARLSIGSEGDSCPPRAQEQLIDQHSDGAYTVLRFLAECSNQPRALDLRYRLFSDLDPQHKGLLRLEYRGRTQTGIFSHDHPETRIDLAGSTPLKQFLDFGREGIWHIWLGFDHLLFLLTLLLPAVLFRSQNRWRMVSEFRPALWDVVRIVSAFTVAHSITLSLATLSVIHLPSRWVESAIAASVVLAALNNLLPVVQGRRWVVAFGFGLIHGFGFASVLADLGLPQGAKVLALVGFNLGVEVGQLAVVAAFLPLAYGLRRSWVYERLVLVPGSVLIAMVASVWLVERVFNLKLLPL
ncbi:MAG: HupE/UreJ family protein [Nitrospirae bacterium]|nr:HupE/UreJ family protein [Nitrospirota bacterium]